MRHSCGNSQFAWLLVNWITSKSIETNDKVEAEVDNIEEKESDVDENNDGVERATVAKASFVDARVTSIPLGA